MTTLLFVTIITSHSTLLSRIADDVLWQYLTMYLGERHRSTMTSVFLSIIYCLVLTTGLLGNVTTCVVIARNSYMHTATNYYLFSLAISDMLSLVFGKKSPDY